MPNPTDSNDHVACVTAWMERNAKDLTTVQLLQLFEQALDALWRRAQRTLGDVTLMAIVDRVLHSAVEKAPPLSALKIEPSGVRCEELHKQADGLSRDELEQGVRFVLVELLTVLGSLTAEILTPALHSELVSIESRPSNSSRQNRAAKPAGSAEEGNP